MPYVTTMPSSPSPPSKIVRIKGDYLTAHRKLHFRTAEDSGLVQHNQSASAATALLNSGGFYRALPHAAERYTAALCHNHMAAVAGLLVTDGGIRLTRLQKDLLGDAARAQPHRHHILLGGVLLDQPGARAATTCSIMSVVSIALCRWGVTPAGSRN
jgi:hypothetical protein